MTQRRWPEFEKQSLQRRDESPFYLSVLLQWKVATASHSPIPIGAPGSLGVNSLPFRRGVVENDKHETVARLGCGVASKGPDLAVDAACVFRNDLAEGVALDGNLLPGRDLFIEFDQKLNESAVGREDGEQRYCRQRCRSPSLSVPSGRR